MSGFGELVLVVGDLHIPDRTSTIPEKFQKMLIPNKMQHVLCTGNLGSKTQYNKLKELAPDFHIVAGDMEYNSSLRIHPDHTASKIMKAFPETKVIKVGHFKIGLVHGHQIIPYGNHDFIAMWRRRLDVDIIISGHTHVNEIVEHEGGWHMNPGSLTGAYSPMGAFDEVIPSFLLLAIQGPKLVCFVYKLINGEVDVSKTEFEKKPEKESISVPSPLIDPPKENNSDSLFDD